MQATALVHEAYVRLVDVDQVQGWESRGHFFSAAAEAMRRILIESARSKGRQKHGGEADRADGIDPGQVADQTLVTPPDQLLEVDAALLKLSEEEPEVAELVRLKLYAGLSLRKAAKVMKIHHSTASDYWRFACAWVAMELDAMGKASVG